MPNEGEGPLTNLARELQARNQQFQSDLTKTCSQAATSPVIALTRLDQSLTAADELERDETAFLEKMGDWGANETRLSKDRWKETRLTISIAKAQVLLILGRYDDAQSAVERAREYAADPADPAATVLDEIEVLIMQARA